MKQLFKRCLPDVLAILFYVVISTAYFIQPISQGKILFRHDTSAGAGAGQEAKNYHNQTGKTTRWTDALFGGMPTYQIAPSYQSTKALQTVGNFYHLGLPTNVWYIFAMMIGFFILMRAMGVNTWLSTLGGLVWGFSSYFFILIAAGHIWKLVTLAYIPPTIAGLIWTYKERYMLGCAVTALFVALQIMSNHVQMTYYFMFVMLFIVIALGIKAYKENKMPEFGRATLVVILAGFIGIAINSSNLYHTYTYSKHTMRGKQELAEAIAKRQQSHEQSRQVKGGLSTEYITQWSYGIDETLTLLIPNYKGGASEPLAKNKKAMEHANNIMQQYGLYNYFTQYFGQQPMTAGPVYVGAFVLVLFLLGCFIVKRPIKWALLGGTVFSILLAWGHNMLWLTELFIRHVPLYNKFRAVSSILVIAEFCIPALAILALVEITRNPKSLRNTPWPLYLSIGGCATICFLVYISNQNGAGTSTPMDMQLYSQLGQQGLDAQSIENLRKSVIEMRGSMVSSDALRSLIIILVGASLLLAYIQGVLKQGWTLAWGIIILCLIDMWGINKRYLYDDLFVEPSQKTQTFKLTEADKKILQDKTIDYRVLNLASNTFSENNTSYWHKSIGGYHAAKLQRYQDLINYHIEPEMQAFAQAYKTANGQMDSIPTNTMPVINMLNTRWLIIPGAKGMTHAIQNPQAYGAAWYIGQLSIATDALEEITPLKQLPKDTAIMTKDMAKGLSKRQWNNSTNDSIRITSYAPNELHYNSKRDTEGLAVFSEIYYPGWTCRIDGKKTKIHRANYILRAVEVPQGTHEIVFTFHPKSLKITEGIAYTNILLLFLLIFAAVYTEWKYPKKEDF